MFTENEKKEKLLALLQEVVKQDQSLRAQFQMGEKFRFIRDRLHALQVSIEEHLAASEKKQEDEIPTLAEDETYIYVYLFNAHGLNLQSWLKMVNASVFYDHSVNRPIYHDKALIETYIKSKTNRAQHGYLTIIVKKTDIVQAEFAKDSMGQALIRVKEGSLKAERLVTFTHNEHDFKLNEAGELVKISL